MVHIGLIIWHQFLICKINVLLSVFIVSKIENIPPIKKFSKIKNKKTAITFGEECSFETEQANVHHAYDLKANHINRLHGHTIKILIFIYQKYGQIPDLNDSLLM